MRLKQIINSLFILVLFSFASCTDIFEEDITSERIALLTPGDSIVSKNLNQQFQWEVLLGAREYRFQIASPSLERPNEFYLDTVVEKNNLNLTLPPGLYNWRVQGLNAGYTTLFTNRSFAIDSSATLNNQEFSLLNPVQGFVTRNPDMIFKWEDVQNADKYLFQILTNPTFDTVVYTTQIKRKLPNSSQSYSWKVTALNSLSLKESATSQFSVDVTSPFSPDLHFPSVDTALIFLPVKFSWIRKSPDVQYDSLYIYDNQNRVVSNFPKRVNNTTYNLTASDITLFLGTYFWAVRSIDKAGNVSSITSKRRFIKQ